MTEPSTETDALARLVVDAAFSVHARYLKSGLRRVVLTR